MKTATNSILALAGGFALLLSVNALAAEEAKEKGANSDPEAKPPVTEAVTAAQNLALAGQLVTYGDQAKDPLALILAAKIMKSTPTQAAEHPKQGETVPADAKKEGGNKRNVSEILNRAKALAAGRQDLLAMIADVDAMTAKGRIPGPGSISTAIVAGGADQFNIRFRGGESAIVVAEGDGDTDLDLYVYDENGHSICQDTDYSDTVICEWTPRWTGNFTVRVVNRGSVYNRYVLVTN